MCGIAAYCDLDSSVTHRASEDNKASPRKWVEGVNLLQRSRGPDGSGVWEDPEGRVCLGHTRLSIIDLSSDGAQPMVHDSGKVVLTFNGEIYNFKELRSGLVLKGYSFRSTSDTEVILNLYVEYGIGMVSRLRGMFAMAIWDAGKQTLFLVRDQLGIKPLYFCTKGRVVRVASQVRAFAESGRCHISSEALMSFMQLGAVADPYSICRDVQALEAGQIAILRRGSDSVEVRNYFDLRGLIVEAEECAGKASIADLAESFRDSFRTSVALHLAADVGVGVFLSAGADSTAVAAVASTLVAVGKRHAVTVEFEELSALEASESVGARSTAAEHGFQHTVFKVTEEMFRRDLPHILASMDQPSIDGVNSYYVAKAARSVGLKVALSGIGGDEILGGYSSFRDIPRLVRAASSLPIPGRIFTAATQRWIGRFTSPKYAGIFEFGRTLPGAYLLRRSASMPWEHGRLCRSSGEEQLTMLMARMSESIKGISSPLLQIAGLEIQWYLRNQLLRDTDWASMCHSLEVRTPLVDVEVMKRGLALLAASPAGSKMPLMGVCYSSSLERSLIRPKSGFATPVGRWIQKVISENGSTRGRGLRLWSRYVAASFTSSMSASQ